MTRPRPVDVGIRLVVDATATAPVVSADTILGANGIAGFHLAKFHARGRLVAGIARRQSVLEDLFDDIAFVVDGDFLDCADALSDLSNRGREKLRLARWRAWPLANAPARALGIRAPRLRHLDGLLRFRFFLRQDSKGVLGLHGCSKSTLRHERS